MRAFAAVTTISLLAAGLLVGVAAPAARAAAAASDITLTATPDASVLAGSKAGVSLTASNTTSTDDYNLAFRYRLPTGVSYVDGSSTSNAGEPTVDTVTYTPDPAKPTVTASYQVLLWSNVADLPAQATMTVGFSVAADPTIFPVGSQFTASAGAYAQSNPRTVPSFDGSGAPNATSYTTSSTVATTSATQVSALKVTKKLPEPEAELMRGVHSGHGAVYTITVTDTTVADTDGATVTDYLPAGLEFLGCGGTAVDNSTGGEEYPGSGRLDGPLVSGDCLTPNSIQTVANPAGHPAGVYTVVSWSIGTLAAGSTTTISYSAGVPLHENTTDWLTSAPTAASDDQGSNLDNNTGSLTRQLGDGHVFTNSATAAGSYTGAVVAGASQNVSASGSASTEADDLSLVKTASSGAFANGASVAIDLELRAGEYTADSDMTVTDTVPNGMCPLVPTGFPITGGALPTDCAAPGSISGGTLTSVTANADGSFTLVFVPAAEPLAPSATTHIGYTTLQRSTYLDATQDPVAAGDTFSAGATVAGTSTAVAATAQSPADETVKDDSKVGFATSAPTISKRILPRTLGIASAADCAAPAHADDYVSNDTATAGFPVFQLGDRICFELQVNFSSSTQTRDAEITDFVPVGTSYDGYAVSATSGVPENQVGAPDTSAANAPVWKIGAPQGDATFVSKGATLTMFVSAIVSAPATGPLPQLTGNLMKYRQASTSGAVLSLRDQANFDRAPAPAVALKKEVTAINGSAVPAAKAHAVTVKENDVLAVQLTITNTGTPAAGNDFTVDGETVWDALPAQLDCGAIAGISDAGSCADDYHGLSGAYAGRSAIVWNLADVIAPGAASAPVSYTMTVPGETSVSTVFSNTASVTSFTSPSTAGGSVPYYPASSLDASKKALANAGVANDTAKATVADATVKKTAITATTVNNTSAQAVAGENASYTYTVTLPAGATFYNGVLSDELPAGLTAGPATTVTADINGATGIVPENVPSGYALSSSGTLTFPDVVNNSTASPQTFAVHYMNLTVSKGEGAWPVAGTPPVKGTIGNTASFTSNSTLGGPAVARRTAIANVAFIVPAPKLEKSASPDAAVADGDQVTFTLTASEDAGLPALYDSSVTDCLPAGLEFVEYGALPAGVTTSDPATGDGTACPTGSTLLRWTVGTVAPAATTTLHFTASVNDAAAGGQSYTNTATLKGSTLDDGANDPAKEGVYTATSNSAVVTVAGASITKTVANAKATVGAQDDYTVTVQLPARINFYGAAVTDQLPAGLLVDASKVTMSCTTDQQPQQDCGNDLPGHAQPLDASGSTIGWLLGDISAASYGRTVVLHYSGTLDASAASQTINVAGAELKNSAKVGWYAEPGSAPSDAGATFDMYGAPAAGAEATVTVTEPTVSITKAVSAAAPQPGDAFTYTVDVTSPSTPTSSAAYDVAVSDAVPAGVLVSLPANLPAGVTSQSISGEDPTTGGGTITWKIGQIDPGTTRELSYTAKLAPSGDLTGGALRNTATVTAWNSMPDPETGRSYPNGTPPAAAATVTPAFPKVALSKATPGGPTAYVDNAFNWSFTAKNTGTGTASSVTATDVLPANWSYVDHSATVKIGTGAAQQLDPTVTTNDGVQTLVWSGIGPLAPSQSAVATYQATPSALATATPGLGADHPNVNTVSAVTYDTSGVAADASGPFTGAVASASAFIDPADVSIVKTAGTLTAGESSSSAWTLTVSNAAGNDTAVGPFTVTDTPSALATGITVTGAAGTGWSCTTPDSAGAFACSRPDSLASGASFPDIHVAATATASVAGGTTVGNTASVTDRTFDPSPTNNADSATLTTKASADLAIAKTLSGSAHAGDPVSWNLAVTNSGPSVATGTVTVTDPVPHGVSGVTASGTGWSCATPITTTVTCTTQDLGVEAAPLITVTGTLSSSFTGTLANTASVSAATTDPETSNNASTATAAAATDTTVTITKSLADGTNVTAGANATYVFTVTNNGPSDARNVTVTDPLPDGLTFVPGSAVSTSGAWSCSEASTDPSTIQCALKDPLSAASGSNTAVVQVSAHVPSSNTGALVNTATVHADNAPAASSTQNSAQNLSSDLVITKSHPDEAVVAGTAVAYTLDVSDQGPSDATGTTTVTDALPDGMRASAVSGTGWDCTIAPDGTSVSCTTNDRIANGAHAPAITVVASLAADVPPGVLANRAAVSGVIPDPATGNNTASDPTRTATQAAVQIVKSVTTGATVTAGEKAGFDITLSNAGPSNAAEVKVSELLPTGMSLVSAAGSGWACDRAGADCTMEAMAPGVQTLHVVALTASSVPDGTILTNGADVNWVDSGGSHTASASASVTVAAHAELALSKTADSSSVEAGTTASFQLAVHNNGSSDAVGPITVVDELPVGMTFVGSAGSAWRCSAGPAVATGQTVSCATEPSVGIPANDAAPALAVQVALDQRLESGPATNRASVTSATDDPEPSDNSASATVQIKPVDDLSITKSHKGPVEIGKKLTFQLAVANAGPSTATGVAVAEQLPAGLEYLSADGSDPAWSCMPGTADDAGTLVACELDGAVGAGSAAPALQIVTTVGAGAYPKVTNTATVSSATADADPANNTASDIVLVPAQVDLHITKSHTGVLQVGKQVPYTITVTNTGSTELPAGYVVTDRLPRGLTLVSASGESCLAHGQTVECPVNRALAVDGTARIQIVARVGEAAYPSVTNTASVSTTAANVGTDPLAAEDPARVQAAPSDATGSALAVTGTSGVWRWLLLGAAIAVAAGLALLEVARRRRGN